MEKFYTLKIYCSFSPLGCKYLGPWEFHAIFPLFDQVLSLYERHPEGPFTPLMPEALETPEIMRHIRRLEFCRAEGSIENPENAGNASTFHPFLEEIIEKSPNLEELKIEDNFYPVLTTCSKLKIVDFSGYPYGFELIDNDEDDDTHRFGNI